MVRPFGAFGRTSLAPRRTVALRVRRMSGPSRFHFGNSWCSSGNGGCLGRLGGLGCASLVRSIRADGRQHAARARRASSVVNLMIARGALLALARAVWPIDATGRDERTATGTVVVGLGLGVLLPRMLAVGAPRGGAPLRRDGSGHDTIAGLQALPVPCLRVRASVARRAGPRHAVVAQLAPRRHTEPSRLPRYVLSGNGGRGCSPRPRPGR